MSNEEFISGHDAAQMLGISYGRTQQLRIMGMRNPARPGALRAKKVGSRWWLSKRSVEDRISYMEKRKIRNNTVDEKKAARRYERLMKQERIAKMREHVFTAIQHSITGMTRYEIADHIGVDSSVVSGRIADLHKSGRIIPNGKRETPSGSKAIIWVAL